MKRIVCLLVIICLCLALGACGETAQEPEPAEPPAEVASVEPTATPEPAEPPIAVLMGGQNEYAETFVTAITPVIEAGGYRVSAYYSANADAQINDLYSAIGEGAAAVAVMPIDMDNMQQVLDDMDLQKIPVINLMVPINGIVRVLVSPDYQAMGEQAAQAAMRARPDGASVLTVEMQDSPFVTQMVHDGFVRATRDAENISLDASVLATGAQDAYQKTKDALAADEGLNVVFVIDEYATPEALRAVQETGRDIAVLSTGGGSGIMQLIQDGSVYASVFSSPYQLAQLAGEYAVGAANGADGSIPQYAQLFLETIDAGNASNYLAGGGYADIQDYTPAAEESEQPQEEDGDGEEAGAEQPEETDEPGTEQQEETPDEDGQD